MHSHRFAAMGSEAHVLLPASRRDAVPAVRELFAEWEAKLSRFMPESELSQLNRRAGERVGVDRVVFDVVAASVAAARETAGIFDPTLLRQLVRVGYAQPFAQRPPTLAPPRGAPTQGGHWREIELDAAARTVRLPEACSLDLGGIAKGMTVDAALELLKRYGVTSALVGAGGDLAVLGLPPAADAWPVLVGDEERGEVVDLARGALATSGVARRSWLQAGVSRHHLIDPRTGEPAETDLYEVTVAAPTCRGAEVAATTCFVLGSRRGTRFLSSRGLGGVLTTRDGRRLAAGSWPAAARDAA